MIGLLAMIAAALVAQTRGPNESGAAIVTARCVGCHEADLIVSQRLSRPGWTREIDKMVRWGAQVPEAEREPLTTYLSEHFAPVPTPSQSRAGAGETVYKGACLACHEGDLVQQQRLSRPSWVREVDKMIRWGARVSPPDRDPLVDYLVARFGSRDAPAK